MIATFWPQPDTLLAVGIDQWLDQYIPPHLQPVAIYGGIALLLLLTGMGIWRRIRRFFRRRRPPTIHPKLQKYNVDQAALSRQRQALAEKIIATSTGPRLVGYRLTQQVEAVFVDGLRTPEDALTALKAAAAQRGANAIINVQTDRTAAGKCSASGDAVIVGNRQGQ